MKKLICIGILMLGVSRAHAQSTEESLTEASLTHFKNSLVDESVYSKMEPKLRKLFACQSRAVFKAGLDSSSIYAYEKFMKGEKVQGAAIEKVGVIFNGAESTCEAEVK